MKNQGILIILLIIFTVITGGCQKDFLDTKPTDLVSDQAIWQDSILADAYVVGRYIGVGLTTEGGKPGFGRGF